MSDTPKTQKAQSGPEAGKTPYTKGDPTKTLAMYCVKCKDQRGVSGIRVVSWPGGRRAAEGICPMCQCKCFKLVKKDFTL